MTNTKGQAVVFKTSIGSHDTWKWLIFRIRVYIQTKGCKSIIVWTLVCYKAMMRSNRDGQVKVTNGALATKNALLRSYCVQFYLFLFILIRCGWHAMNRLHPTQTSRSINTIIEDMGPCQMGTIKTMTTPEIQTFGGLFFTSPASSVVFKYNMYRFPETRQQQIRQPYAIYSHL